MAQTSSHPSWPPRPGGANPAVIELSASTEAGTWPVSRNTARSPRSSGSISTTWRGRLRSSQSRTGLVVTVRPTSTAASGRRASARASSASRWSAVATTHPGSCPAPAGSRHRTCEMGSPSRGQPAQAANRLASAAQRSSRSSPPPGQGPATTTPRSHSATTPANCDNSTGRSRPSSVSTWAAPTSGEDAAGAGTVDTGSSGSRRGQLRWTGPGSGPDADPTAVPAHPMAAPGPVSSTTGRSRLQRTAVPYRPTWSMVWGEPQPRSSGGRSAVHTIMGMPAWEASTTAGR